LCLKLTLGFSVSTLEIAGLEEDVDATSSATTSIAPCTTTVGADVASTHKVVRTDPDRSSTATTGTTILQVTSPQYEYPAREGVNSERIKLPHQGSFQ